MQFVNVLNSQITPLPLLVEVSINGIWEDAWHIDYKEGIPSREAVEAYLAKGTERIAVEVFFKTIDGYTLFLGIRFNEKLKTATPKKFLTTCFQSIWSMTSPSFSGIVSDLSKQLTGDERILFDSYPTAIELGVVNWWQSLGNIEIWNQQQKKMISKIMLQQQLNGSPHLLHNNHNYTGLEFNYQVIPHYWLGIQVADKKGEKWVLNENRIEGLLKNLLHFSID